MIVLTETNDLQSKASLKNRWKSKTKGNCTFFVYFNEIYLGIYSTAKNSKTRQILNIKRYNVFKSILFPSSVARSLCAIKCGTASILFLIWLHNCDNFIRHCRALFETFGRDATRELRGVVKKCWKLCTLREMIWWIPGRVGKVEINIFYTCHSLKWKRVRP